MVPYKTLYAMLLGSICDAIDLLERQRSSEAIALLKSACLYAEDAAIDAMEPDVAEF